MPENIIVTSCWVDGHIVNIIGTQGPTFLPSHSGIVNVWVTEFSNADSNHAKKLSSLSIHSFQDPSIFMFGS